MDKDELQKNIVLYYSKLTPKAQKFFSDMEWMQKIEKISEKYTLTNEQKQVLGVEMTLLLLGIIHPVEFGENIAKELNLKTNILEKLQEEIDSSILKNIHQDVVEAFNKNKKEENIADESPDDSMEEKFTETVKIKDRDNDFTNMPKKIEDLTSNPTYQSVLYAIAKNHKLNVAQMGYLDTATTKLIQGTIQPEEYKEKIQRDVKINGEEAQRLVDEINTKIFIPIREQLKGTNTKKESENLPKTDLEDLKSHGIEIVEEEKPTPKIPETTPSKILKGKEEPLEIQAPKAVATPAPTQPSIPKITPTINIHPLLDKKMSGPVQTLVSKNQYGINNVPIKAEEKSTTTGSDTKTSGYKAGQDPYRIKPGE